VSAPVRLFQMGDRRRSRLGLGSFLAVSWTGADWACIAQRRNLERPITSGLPAHCAGLPFGCLTTRPVSKPRIGQRSVREFPMVHPDEIIPGLLGRRTRLAQFTKEKRGDSPRVSLTAAMEAAPTSKVPADRLFFRSAAAGGNDETHKVLEEKTFRRGDKHRTGGSRTALPADQH